MTLDRRVVVLGCIQALVLLALASVVGTSRDEEYAMATTARGIGYAYHRAIDYELQAPLYFVVLAIWRFANDSLFFARALSVAAIVALTFVGARSSQQIRPGRSPLPLCIALAINPFVVYAAEDIRSYPFALVFAALTIVAFVDGFWREDAQPRARLWFVLWSLLGIATQYFHAFILVGLFAALLVTGRLRRTAAYTGWALVVAACAIAFVHAAAGQISAYDQTPQSPLHAAREALTMPWREFVAPGDALVALGLPNTIYHVLVVVQVAALLVGGIRFRRPAVRAGLAAIVAMHLCYLFVAVGLHVELVAPRHYVALTIPLVFTWAIVVSQMRGSRARLAAGVSLAIYAVFALSTIGYAYRRLAKAGDWQRVGGYLEQHAPARATIAVFEADAVPELRRYYRGRAQVVPLPHAVDPDRYVADALVMHSLSEARQSIATFRRRDEPVFIVVDCAYHTPQPHDGCEFLAQAIDEVYPGRSRRDFYEGWIAELGPEKQ